MSVGRAERGLGLVLSLIPYVAASGSVSVAEAAAHFGVAETRIREAVLRVFMAGVPDGAGDFIRFDIDYDAFEGQDIVSLTQRPALHDETVRLSPREATALIAGLTLVADYTDATPAQVDRLRAKLQSAASQGAATLAVDRVRATEIAQCVRDAMRERRVLSLVYRKPGAASSTRRVAPTRLEVRDGQVFLEGVDLDRSAMRTFRLDRIESAEPSDAAWPATLPRRERVAGRVATVVATSAAAAMLADYASSPPVAVGDGRVRFDVNVWNEASVLRAIASCGGAAVIVAPQALREAMWRFADDALAAPPAPSRDAAGVQR